MDSPRVVSCSSMNRDPAAAAGELANQVASQLGALKPRGIIFSSGAAYEPEALQSALRAQFPEVPFIGATSCLGTAVPGHGLARGAAITALVLAGEGFTFATAFDSDMGDLAAAGQRLAMRALGQVRMPRFALVHATPGLEEGILAGLGPRLPAGIPTLGGSAADDDLSGRWAIYTQDGVARAGVALAVCDWPWKMAVNYQGGYMTTEKRGTVTRAAGRTIYEIDGQPAAKLYNEWIRGKLDEELRHSGNVLAKTTLCPLGIVRRVGTAEMYLLAHPERVDATQASLSLFAEIHPGEEVVLMKSSPAALEQRGANVARRALAWARLEPADVLGAVFIYCGGCLLAIQERGSAMVSEFEGALGKRPYVAQFAFGEQGCVWPGTPVDHGNLMASVLLLSGVPEQR